MRLAACILRCAKWRHGRSWDETKYTMIRFKEDYLLRCLIHEIWANCDKHVHNWSAFWLFHYFSGGSLAYLHFFKCQAILFWIESLVIFHGMKKNVSLAQNGTLHSVQEADHLAERREMSIIEFLIFLYFLI